MKNYSKTFKVVLLRAKGLFLELANGAAGALRH